MLTTHAAVLRRGPIIIAKIANGYGRRGDFVRAEKLLLGAVIANPDNRNLWGLLGRVQHERGLTEEAVRSLSVAIQLGDVYSRLTRGICSELLGRLDDAEADYLAVLVLAPDDVDALVNLGTLQGTLGRLSAAASTLSRAAALDPQANWPLSDALSDLGDVEGAIEAALAAVKAGEARAHLELAKLLMDRESRDDVIGHFEAAIKAGREWARRELVIYLDNEGLSAQALRLATSGVRSGDRLCYAPLAVILEAKGDLRKAAHYYRLAIVNGDVEYEKTLLAIESELGGASR